MGDDLRVANAARVSFNKESKWELKENKEGAFSSYELTEADQKLINYLAKHNHWTPFSHVQITLREKVPIFVARQRFKHMVGFTYNEVSRRYVNDPPEFFSPDAWRGKPDNAKQGSSEKIITELVHHEGSEDLWGDLDNKWHPDLHYQLLMNTCREFYEHLLASGVAPEQARMVLPQSMYTEYYTTGSLAAWARAYKLRSDPHSQKEIQDLATKWNEIIGDIKELEHSWKALTN